MPARAYRPYAADPVARRQRIDEERSDDPIRKLYHTPTWRATRAEVLARDPLCCECHQALATIVHHIIGARKYMKLHGNDQATFFHLANLQGTCKRCHDSITASECGFAGAPA